MSCQRLTRREVLRRTLSICGGLAFAAATPLTSRAASAIPAAASGDLDVAYAGSMGALMEGAVQDEMRSRFGLTWHGRAQGATALARLIAADTIKPDVFVAATPSPMQIVLAAGKADRAVPIAQTEMVIAYSAQSAFASEFKASANGRGRPWWQLLERSDVRFGRTDPGTDPQGRNIIFVMELAAAYYHKPHLVERVLGDTFNAQQIFPEPTVIARLQAGQLDASSAYKTQPAALGIPFLTLPPEVNLGSASLASQYQNAHLNIDGKEYRPEPLVFYAAVLNQASNPNAANAFVRWLTEADGQSVLRRFHYDPVQAATVLTR